MDAELRPSRSRWNVPGKWWLWVLLSVMAFWFFVLPLVTPTSSTSLTYSTFVHDVTAGHVSTATISTTGEVTGLLVGGAHYTSVLPTAIGAPKLSALLLRHHVAVTALPQSSFSLGGLILTLLPYVILIGGYWWLMRRMRSVNSDGTGTAGPFSTLMGIGKSKAKLYDEERPRVRFSDIAGYETTKAEVMEVVDFLKNPVPYARAGAVGPKGVLMVGPPGTGKTLMARAVAGEAGVPFFALSGSSFVEMFVGVGASRVRSLFEDARKRSPAIIFIDEIDAIGAHRGHGGLGTNEEREQTLNQLLSEMDGFEPGSNVVVVAATNRVDVLDAALLRPGRFDRTVEIPLPNQAERTQILAIHASDKRLSEDVDLDAVSRGTPGFAGADLANLVNEAAIEAVRGQRGILTAEDFGAARDRLLLGHRSSTGVLLPDEKTAVAAHEAGHALVALLSPHADPVAKVTILPRGASLGVTEQLPLSERHLYPVSYLVDTLAVRLGGRAAEIVVRGEASSGASNDLGSATDLATRMVREWGLSTKLGPVGYASGPNPEHPLSGPPYAEDTQRAIDQEVATLLRAAEETAMRLLRTHRNSLDSIITMLLERETITGQELAEAAGLPTPPPEQLDHRDRPTTLTPPATLPPAATTDVRTAQS